MAGQPSPVGAGRGGPVLRTLSWSIAVVLSAGVLAAFTTPTGPGPTVRQQDVGIAVSAGPPAPGTAVPPGAAAGGGPQAVPVAGPTPTAGSPASATSAAPTTKVKGSSAPTTATRSTAAPAAAGAAAARTQPDQGRYPLRISGTSTVGGKASSVPTTGSLVVEQRGGDQQHRTVGVPGGLVLVQRASAAGVDLVSFSLTAGSKTLTFRPPAPLAFVRTDQGASWSWSVRSTDGTVVVNQTASTTGSGSVAVGGTSVPTVTVQRVFSVSGAVQGSVRLTSSLSQVDRLPLLQHQVIDVSATVLGLLSTRVVSDTTATLTSTRPS